MSLESEFQRAYGEAFGSGGIRDDIPASGPCPTWLNVTSAPVPQWDANVPVERPLIFDPAANAIAAARYIQQRYGSGTWQVYRGVRPPAPWWARAIAWLLVGREILSRAGR